MGLIPGISQSKESGSALVSILVAVGILGVVVSMSMSGTAYNMRAAKMVESKGSFNSIEQAFSNEIGGVIRSLSQDSCLLTESLQNRPFGFDNSQGTLSYINQSFEKGSPRCSSSTFISATDVANNAASHLHFCMAFRASEVGTRSSIFASGTSHAEIAIDFEDIKTGNPISCRQYLQEASSIARIHYGLYLIDEKSGKDFSKKFGSVIVKSPE